MPGITNRLPLVPLLLFLTFPIWSGCRSEQPSPIAAKKAKVESSAQKSTQSPLPVVTKEVKSQLSLEPRVELTNAVSKPKEAEAGPEEDAATNRTNKESDHPSSSKSVGTLIGRVLLSGKTPPARKITVTKNQDVCAAAGGEVRDVVVSSQGGIEDVVVEILGIEPGGNGFQWNRPENGYVLRQKGCQFKPPLLVMPIGEKLTVVNDDPIGHNVNSGQWNEQQPGGGAPIVRQLSGNRPVRVGCNVHSWMETWVYLARSPFYAVTDAGGNYRIENVPPGTYRVTYWHPSLRPIREKVSIEAGQVDQLEAVLKSPVRN